MSAEEWAKLVDLHWGRMMVARFGVPVPGWEGVRAERFRKAAAYVRSARRAA
jgi:hypothetical protein